MENNLHKKTDADANSLFNFITNKFGTGMDPEKLNKFKAMALFIDEQGTLGLSMGADEAYEAYSNSGALLELTPNDFAIFLANSFVYKWLDNKVIEIQRPVLRSIIMNIKDNKLNNTEMKGLESFRSLVEKNEESSNGVMYVYVQTNIRKGDESITDKLIEDYVTEDR